MLRLTANIKSEEKSNIEPKLLRLWMRAAFHLNGCAFESQQQQMGTTVTGRVGFYGFSCTAAHLRPSASVCLCATQEKKKVLEQKSQHGDLEMTLLHSANWPGHFRVITRWIRTCTDPTYKDHPTGWLHWH